MKFRPQVDWKKRGNCCNGCGYDMSATFGSVCPECGRDVSKHMSWNRDGTWAAHTLAIFAFGAGLLAGGIYVAMVSIHSIPRTIAVTLLATGLTVGPIAALAWASQRHSRRKSNFLCRYALVGGACLLAYALVNGVWLWMR